MDSLSILAAASVAAGKIHWTEEFRKWLAGTLTDPWVAFGFAAQCMFASRFVVQWIASERQGRSVVPVAFWYLSILGTLMLATYAVYRKDIVFILGNTLNTFIYIRNLTLIYRPKPRSDGAASQAPA